MNCSRAQERFADLLDGRLAAKDTADVRAHLASCPDCQREYASLAQTLAALDQIPAPRPSPHLRSGFYAMLEEEKNSAASIQAAVQRQRRSARISFWSWLLAPLAAGALALAAFFAGTRFAPPAPAPGIDAATKREIADLRRQVDTMGQAVFDSLIQQRSTTDRLKLVLATLDQKSPDKKVLSDLVGALAFDTSVNVRLSALDALYPHASEQLVRSGVLASLPREQNPLVQVAMIDFLVAARDRDAAPEIAKLARSESVDRAVRDAAQRALAQL